MNMFTTYEVTIGTYMDLCEVLRTHVGQTVKVRMRPGQRDLTPWGWARAKYGPSTVVIHDDDRTSLTLSAWRPKV